MISKKEFDLLLREISDIEEKITELKVLNKFEKANEYDQKLADIRTNAAGIVLDTSNEARRI